MTVKEKIIEAMTEVAESTSVILKSDLTDDSVLLESGLDSLGFAILVSVLEEKLGYDPFVLMEEPVYPQTLGEFTSVYERFYNQ